MKKKKLLDVDLISKLYQQIHLPTVILIERMIAEISQLQLFCFELGLPTYMYLTQNFKR